jgi:hypothetical protein
MLSRRTLLAAPVALALPAAADGKKRKKPKHKQKSRRKQKPVVLPTLQADTTLPILRDLALHHVHSWDQEGLPIPDLVAKYRAGETLHVICGSISAVAVQVLRAAGYQARVVGVVTKQPFDGDNDGHIMVEVWQPGGWRLYDIDGNRRAVNAAGWGVNIVTQVEAGANRLWEAIADGAYGLSGDGPMLVNDAAQAALDQRVFGTPWIQVGRKQVFNDASDRKRLTARGHTYLKNRDWNRLLVAP